MDEDVACPFCGVTSFEAAVIQYHIEESHSEHSDDTKNGFIEPAPNAYKADQAMPDTEWTKCTRLGCGEYVHLSDIDEHLDIHNAASDPENASTVSSARSLSSSRQAALTESRSKSPRTSRRRSIDRSPNRGSISLLEYFSGRSSHGNSRPKRIRRPLEPGRLGRRELGPHAYEKSMPPDVRRRLVESSAPRWIQRIGRNGQLVREAIIENETAGLIPVIADLSALIPTTEATYLCHPGVKHVYKIQCDGNFCGFWNIQMVLSFLQATGQTPSAQQLPNVLQLQDTIERAWDSGICSYGRIETGGIRGTRKWIGTSEALAFFTQTGANVEALSFGDEDESDGDLAVVALLDYVEAYFMSGLDAAKHHGTSHTTQLAPIYLQRLGHSMTIIGLERKKDGSRNLLLFDPSFSTSDGMRRIVANRKVQAAPETLLRAYQRSDQSLARWDEFELIVPQSSVTATR